MKKFILTFAFIILLSVRVNAAYIHRDLSTAADDDCVPASLSYVLNISYKRVPGILEQIHREQGTNSWRSTYTIRHFLHTLGYELCIPIRKLNVRQLADVGIPILIGIDNPNCHHLVGAVNGNYFDKVDTGDYIADFFFVRIDDIDKIEKYIDYVWWYEQE